MIPKVAKGFDGKPSLMEDGVPYLILSEVYAHYTNWCERNGVKPKPSRMFFKEMRVKAGVVDYDSRVKTKRIGEKTHKILMKATSKTFSEF